MKKFLVLAVSVLALSAGSAMAQGPYGDGGKGPGGHHRGNAIEMMDADKDGQVSKAEFDAFHEAKFKKFDVNGDGFITKEEIEESMKAKRFEMLDTNGDGSISKEEMEARQEQKREKFEERKGKPAE